MKFAILALSLLSPIASHAAARISCNSYPVSFSITSATALNQPGAQIEIVAEGMQTYVFPAVVNVVESTEPLMVVNITTLDSTGNENLRTSMNARIELEVEKTEGGALALKGPGKIQITKLPKEGRPRQMRSMYSLFSCTGAL